MKAPMWAKLFHAVIKVLFKQYYFKSEVHWKIRYLYWKCKKYTLSCHNVDSDNLHHV